MLARQILIAATGAAILILACGKKDKATDDGSGSDIPTDPSTTTSGSSTTTSGSTSGTATGGAGSSSGDAQDLVSLKLVSGSAITLAFTADASQSYLLVKSVAPISWKPVDGTEYQAPKESVSVRHHLVDQNVEIQPIPSAEGSATVTSAALACTRNYFEIFAASHDLHYTSIGTEIVDPKCAEASYDGVLKRLFMIGHHLFARLNDVSGTIKVYDVTSPASPTLVGSLRANPMLDPTRVYETSSAFIILDERGFSLFSATAVAAEFAELGRYDAIGAQATGTCFSGQGGVLGAAVDVSTLTLYYATDCFSQGYDAGIYRAVYDLTNPSAVGTPVTTKLVDVKLDFQTVLKSYADLGNGPVFFGAPTVHCLNSPCVSLGSISQEDGFPFSDAGGGLFFKNSGGSGIGDLSLISFASGAYSMSTLGSAVPFGSILAFRSSVLMFDNTLKDLSNSQSGAYSISPTPTPTTVAIVRPVFYAGKAIFDFSDLAHIVKVGDIPGL